MNTLVVYDSVQGNTEKIAQAIGAAVGAAIGADVPVLRPTAVDLASLDGIELLIVGAPTHGGRPTAPIQEFLDKLPASAIAGKRFAAFDTRLPAKWVKLFSFAAPRITKQLGKLGGRPIGYPGGFFVEGSKPPVLLDGELERAAGWAKEIAAVAG